MNAVEKEKLMSEAKMQMTALKKINGWKNLAIVLSAVGVAIAYGGFAGTPSHLFLGILGIFLTVAGFAAAAVFGLGLKNGRRNVEKMLCVLGGSRKS
ncbi:MAG: hypothetical protein HDQ98_08155 [Lachnospiraceae bacterium]|nr:hypothetical protein [Lachnospiraceae bacterium]